LLSIVRTRIVAMLPLGWRHCRGGCGRPFSVRTRRALVLALILLLVALRVPRRFGRGYPVRPWSALVLLLALLLFLLSST
jgi:hypothetical protein